MWKSRSEVNLMAEYVDVISNDEVKDIEKAVQEEPAPLETPNYFVIPDNDSQTITIMPDIEGAVLKLDKTNALILASIIQEQVVGFWESEVRAVGRIQESFSKNGY